MESPLRWILSKFNPIKMAFMRKSNSKEKAPKSPQRNLPERKLKKVRILDTRARAPLF